MTDRSYSDRMRQRFLETGEGFKVVLKDGAWWSRGWRGCPNCDGNVCKDVSLRRFVERRPGGIIASGWRCGGE